MLEIIDGQCGRCLHYGDAHAEHETLVHIRINGIAPEGLIAACGHPSHATSCLRVGPDCSCERFTPAA